MNHLQQSVIDVIIPTFNRCPHHPDGAEGTRNPLLWTLETLATQNQDLSARILVVDNGSKDHTQAVVEAVARRHPYLPIHYIPYSERRGSIHARNYGAKQATASHLLFTDDDCLFPQGVLRRAYGLLRRIAEDDYLAAALNLPYYLRAHKPKAVVSMDRIGVVNLNQGCIEGNFDTLPAEYVHQEPRIELFGEQLLAPFVISNLGCTYLVDRMTFESAGGFPTDFDWSNSYGEETELAVRIGEVGRNLYFAPDPRCHVVHMKYGARMADLSQDEESSERVMVNGSALTLNQLGEWSNSPDSCSGNRVELAYCVYTRVLSYLCIIGTRSHEGSLRWLSRSYQEVVVEGKGIEAGRLSCRERENAWRAATRDGLRWLGEVLQ
jgi:glycosyltransferase involved in cell wall biosynthesis